MTRGQSRKICRLAIRAGELIRPNNCSKCSVDDVLISIHSHHINYEKPLEVEWLCTNCHNEAHGNKKIPDMKGRKLSEAIKCKISDTSKLRICTKETRIRISENNGRYWQGRHHTEEELIKISKILMIDKEKQSVCKICNKQFSYIYHTGKREYCDKHEKQFVRKKLERDKRNVQDLTEREIISLKGWETRRKNKQSKLCA